MFVEYLFADLLLPLTFVISTTKKNSSYEPMNAKQSRIDHSIREIAKLQEIIFLHMFTVRKFKERMQSVEAMFR
jgi:hypothetical protein